MPIQRFFPVPRVRIPNAVRVTPAVILIALYLVHLRSRSIRLGLDCAGPGRHRTVNLVEITKTWATLRADRLPSEAPNQSPPTAADLSRRHSEWADPRAAERRLAWLRLVHKSRLDPAITAGFLLLLALLARRGLRWTLLGGALVSFLFALAYRHAVPLADFVWPPGHQYVNDYAYVTGFEWRRSRHDLRIIAYEKRPWRGHDRIVALEDLSVHLLREPDFLALARTQDLDPLPP